MVKTGGEQFLDIRRVGIEGLDAINDPADISDQSVSDILNMVFDSGVAAPRLGSVVFADKPTGETADPLQIAVATTSDGLRFVIAIYGNNFYLRDEDNSRWVKLNHTYTPTETDLWYGNIPWNGGRGDDRHYFCNGVDNFAKWHVCLTTLASNHSSGASTVTVADDTRFPSTGTLIINDGSTEITAAYTSHTGNVFTLSGTLSSSVTSGASVTVELVEKSGMEKGTVLARWQRRLVSANRYGGEINLYYSVVDDPEDFSTGDGTSDGGFLQFSDGNGGIIGLHDYGSYILVEKKDSLNNLSFTINDTLDAKLDKIDPIMSGVSMGPLNTPSIIKVLNSLYFPTESNGIVQLNPKASGGQIANDVQNLSKKVFPFINGLNFDNARVAYADQKMMWACATGESNNIIVMYDMIRAAWTKFDSWNAKDIFSKDDKFFYLSRIDGKIYECLTSQNDDGNPYIASFTTKRHNFGKPSLSKVADAVYIEGYMTDAAKFFVDVIFNELGRLSTVTYEINASTPGLYFAPVPLNAAGQFPQGLVPQGEIPESQIGNLGIFRGYLSIPSKYAFYNLQLRFYSISTNSRWSCIGYAINPSLKSVIHPLMRINPSKTNDGAAEILN